MVKTNYIYGDLTNKDHEILGICTNPSVEHINITPSDDTIDYNKCVDFAPLAEFEDEDLEKSLKDNESEVMNFD